MLYSWILDKTLNYYQSLIRYYESVLENSPDGHVLLQDNHGHPQFLHVYRENGKMIRRGINRKEDIQRALARKEFALESLIILRENASILSDTINRLVPFDPDAILAGMIQAYRRFPEEYFFERDQLNIAMELESEAESRIKRHRAYGDMNYVESDYHNEHKKTRTSRGILVRSKSEALIMERLDSYGIAYHYDEGRMVGGKWIVPDFTFEGADGRLFFWEHMGMMSNTGYAEDNIDKLRKYMRAGIVPGDDLILSFDQDGSIDMRVIDAIIQTQLIPKL